MGLKSKLHLFLVDSNGDHKKAKGMNRNVAAAISLDKYKDVLLNNKCMRHSIKIIQSKDRKIETYEINKISLPCLDDKIYIQDSGYDGLLFIIRVNL